MLTMIEGPKLSTLNGNADGPFTLEDRADLAATEWLFEHVLDNN